MTCNRCKSSFDHKVAYKKHINRTPPCKIKSKIKSKTKQDNIFILPFGGEEINRLSMEDKLEIFASKDPITSLITKTNLNPLFPEYHNVGFGLESKADNYGVIYNGTSFEKRNIDIIMDELLHAKKRDLEKISEEIKQYLKDRWAQQFNRIENMQVSD